MTTEKKATSKIDTEQAVILDVEQPKKYFPQNTSQNKDPILNAVASLTCFLDMIDFFVNPDLPAKNQYRVTTQEVREKIQQLLKLYTHYASILKSLANTPEASILSTYKKISITNESLRKALETNLIENTTNNNKKFCKAFVRNFISYYEVTIPSELKNPLEWMQIAASNLYYIVPGVLAEMTAQLLPKLNSSKEEALKTATPGNYHKESTIIFNFFLAKIAAHYGFHTNSTWKPDSSFEEFMAQIKVSGCLTCGGYFGESFYSKGPFKKTIGDLSVLAWHSNTFSIPEEKSLGHQIIVVGASRKGYQNLPQDVVYFIDPSRNNNLLYIVSYENFCQRIGDISGTISKKPPANATYFYTHPKFAPIKKIADTPNSFWKNINCKNVSVATVATVSAAVTAYIVYNSRF